MRILSGKLKGSKLLTNELKIKSSKNFITRPTSVRVKETLFNIIQHAFNIDFHQISFLDCFSGSGAIEQLVTLKYWVKRLKPDIAIEAFYPNDIVNKKNAFHGLDNGKVKIGRKNILLQRV